MPSLNFPNRPLFHLVTYGIVAVTLLLLLLPQIVGQGLIYGLGRYSSGAASIDNVDINLFTGRLAVDELQVYRSAAQVLRVGHAEVELDWHALWSKRVQIRSLIVDNLSVTVEQPAGGVMRVAGFPLPAAGSDAATENAGSEASPWGFGIGEVALRDNAVQLIRPGLSLSLGVDRVMAGPLHSWEPSVATPFSIALSLNRSQLLLDGSATPYAETPEARLDLKLSDFTLADIQPLLPASIGTIEGVLSAALALEVKQAAGELTLQQEGSLQLQQFMLSRPGQAISNRNLEWQGNSKLSITSALTGASLKGSIQSEALRVVLADNHLALATGGIQWSGDLSLGKHIDELKSSGQLRISDISLAGVQAKKPHTSLNVLELRQLQLQGIRDIHVAELYLSGLQGALQRKATGIQPLKGHLPASSTASRTAEKKGTAPATRLRIDAVRLEGNNRIQFEDATTHPVFRQTLAPELFTLGAIDSAVPDQGAEFSLRAKLDTHSAMTVTGEVTPFMTQPGVSLKAKIREFEMPPLTPYLVQQLGYRINSGQLDSDLELKIADNAMQGEVRIKARQLEMEPEDPARIEQFEQKSSMPIKTALGLLRDDDGNIDIKVPLTGKLDDPKFDLSDAINTALANTMRSAAVSYLKYLLQPYSSVVTLVKLAGKAGGGVQLEPITFAAGKAEPQNEASGYIEKLAMLFAERENLQLRLCGVATTADLVIISKGKLKEIPAEGHEALETLARQRAESVKRIMVEQYGLDPAKLFICHPELDTQADALPRVRLQL